MRKNMMKIKLGISPIAWTNDDLPELGGGNTFEQCVSEMALAGFAGCEIGNKFPKDPEVLRHYLTLRGLSVCNAWYSTFFAAGRADETLAGFVRHRDFLYAMGAGVIGCSEPSFSIQGLNRTIFGDKPIFNDAQWRLVHDGYKRLSELAAQRDMRVCMHHHMGTGVQTADEIAAFMRGAGPDVFLLFDTGHIYCSEWRQDAVDSVIDTYVDRVAHVHLKDVRREVFEEAKAKSRSFLESVRRGLFTVPGDGAISFGHTFKALDAAGYEGWLVVEAEQDPAAANPFEYALRARKFIKESIGV